MIFYYFYFVRQLWPLQILCFLIAYAETDSHKMDYFVADLVRFAQNYCCLLICLLFFFFLYSLAELPKWHLEN